MVLPGIAFVAFSALASLKIFKCGPDEQAVCFQVTDACIQDAIALLNHHATNENDKHNNDMEALLKHAVVVDFGSRMKPLKQKVLAYRDLSPTGNAEAGVRFVQSVLEWAHQVPGAAVILLPMIVDNVVEDDETTSSVTGFLTTIQQRFRAETATGERVTVGDVYEGGDDVNINDGGVNVNDGDGNLNAAVANLGATPISVLGRPNAMDPLSSESASFPTNVGSQPPVTPPLPFR